MTIIDFGGATIVNGQNIKVAADEPVTVRNAVFVGPASGADRFENCTIFGERAQS